MKHWLAIFLILGTGCSMQATYEDARHRFTPTRPVPRDQPDWQSPATLKIHPLETQAEVHMACNDTRVGSKGSHFTALGLHRVSIQDRGCYIYDMGPSIGHVFYLHHDIEALKHEKEHHLYGPAHSGPPPMRGLAYVGNRSDQVTGSRIQTAYVGGGQ